MYNKEKWEVSKYNETEIWVGANINIATCHRLGGTGQANARRICQCVNSHDGLVEKLQWAYGELTNTYEGLSLLAEEIPPQYQEIAAALAEAEKEA